MIFILMSFMVFSETTEKIAEHAREKAPTFFDFLFNAPFIIKYYAMIILGLISLALLLMKKMKPKIKISILLLSTFLFGFAGNIPVKPFSFFSMHPSPMCITKAILYGFAIPFVVALGVVLLLTLIGPRLFCGYICPVGTLQELMALLAGKLKIKRKSFNFIFAHSIRVILFILFIFLSATTVLHVVYEGEIYANSLYDYMNAFHGMEFGMPESLLDALTHYLPLLLTVLLAVKYYRPFCHFLCPVGLFTHWVEQVSLFRISLKKPLCNNCGACVQKAPCKAMDDILKSSTLRPDCYACNVCVEVCPENALKIGTKKTAETAD
jgi:polyferredoxin